MNVQELAKTDDILFYENPIKVGDRFYHNNHTTKIGASLPDYLIITKIKVDHPYATIYARYENHWVDTVERMFSDIILYDSNLYPYAEDPSWIFVRKEIASAIPLAKN